MEKIVKDGLRDCTVYLDGSECEVRFDTCFRAFAVRNDSGADVFISKSSGIAPDADGVMCVKSGGSAVFAHNDLDKNAVYLLGTGKVIVHGQQDSNNPFNYAPTIDGGVQASGNPVVIDGLQGGVPFSKITVSGKNLIKNIVETVTTVGVSITKNADNSITLNGTATSDLWLLFDDACPIIKGKTYTFSSGLTEFTAFTFGVRSEDNNISYLGTRTYGSFVSPVTGACRVRAYAEKGASFNNITIYPQLELGSTPTEYEPPITGRELTVGVSGKNLIGIAQAKAVTGDNKNGFFVFDNSASRSIIQKLQPNTTYHIKKYDSGNRFRIVMFDDEPTNTADVNAKQLIYISDGSVSDYTLTTGENHLWMVLTTHYATSGDAIEPIVQLELGDTPTAYEPYHGSVTTITPDCNPYVIPNDIRQVDGLNNISVSAGTLSVTGVRKNAAIKRIWDKLDELTTAIIVSNGETTE